MEQGVGDDAATRATHTGRRILAAVVVATIGLAAVLAVSPDARRALPDALGLGPRIEDPGLAALDAHLASWQACQHERLAAPSAACEPAPPPPEHADVAAQLRALAGLERQVARYADAGGAPDAVARCLVSVTGEIRSVARRRMLGEAPPATSRASTLDCEAVALADLAPEPEAHDFTQACAYAFVDGDGGGGGEGGGDGEDAENDALSRCVRTLANARLAEGGVGPPLRRPNLVVILTDDQRYDTVDATHSPSPARSLPAMPVVQGRLAGEGLTFTQAIVTTPICGPSRGSFFTGRYVYRHGMLANGSPLGPERFDASDTWATRLHAAGYRTAFLGKYLNGFTELWTPGVDAPVVPPGWDDFRHFNHANSVPQTKFEMVENGAVVSYDVEGDPYSTDVLAQHALSFIERSVADSPETPFALWVSTSTPHAPYDAAPRHVGAFRGYRLVTAPSTYEADVSDKPEWIQALPLTNRPIDRQAHWRFRTTQLEMQLSTDELVAAVLDRLDALGVGDDTIVLFTSDNGFGWGEHRWNSKGCPWEECLRVPMLLRYPRLVPGPRSVDGLVANIDVTPTLLSLARATQPEDVDGLDLSDVVRGRAAVPERTVLIESYASGGQRYAGVRTERKKYVRYATGEDALYDLVRDPWELEDFSERGASRAALAELRSRLDQLWPGFSKAFAE